jgi:flagellar motor switch protein FliN/FliY
MESITRQQADIIGEVANICIGNAATTLSMILNHSTNITTPNVTVLSDEKSLSQPDRILVKVPYTKGLDGTNIIVLQERDALVIASLMMGGDGTGTDDRSVVDCECCSFIQ